MMPPVGERIAALEIQVKDLRGDVEALDKSATSLREFQLVLMAGATIIGTIIGLLVQFAPNLIAQLFNK